MLNASIFYWQILETASWLIVSQLLEYCYSGFLVPVLGPALFQVFCDYVFISLRLGLSLPEGVVHRLLMCFI